MPNPPFKLLGDPHLGKQFLTNVPLHRRGERERRQWELFEQGLDPNGAPLHINMGDLFDKAIVPLTVIMRAAELYLTAAVANPDTTFVVLRGNHDASRDLEAVSAFDIFRGLTAIVPNILVLTEPVTIAPYVFFPWSPTVSAKEMVEDYDRYPDNSIAFGHFDLDPRVDPFNLIPAGALRAQGVQMAFSGHVHLPQNYIIDGLPVMGVGSMMPLAHGEDPTGDTYVTLSLTEVKSLIDPSVLKDKCVRIMLAKGDVFDLDLDCLQLQVITEEAPEMEVSLGAEFDLLKLFDSVMEDHGVPSEIQQQVRSEWDARFTAKQ